MATETKAMIQSTREAACLWLLYVECAGSRFGIDHLRIRIDHRRGGIETRGQPLAH